MNRSQRPESSIAVTGSTANFGIRPTVLAIESLVFIGVHVTYGEIPAIILSGVLGMLMAFIAYGRMVLKPIV